MEAGGRGRQRKAGASHTMGRDVPRVEYPDLVTPADPAPAPPLSSSLQTTRHHPTPSLLLYNDPCPSFHALIQRPLPLYNDPCPYTTTPALIQRYLPFLPCPYTTTPALPSLPLYYDPCPFFPNTV
ncbi:hypothetical protein Pmani_024952 [Petrolisthes manimaculis]|uniref:Uncharacterized protein n=1 Tax=Petrolisthes manimaculis TaxID=1843537 RepID=A0AAE1P931_9EUCA|nr:hypothetical protein Pmani_024952 [Petrolisthes manimaculis]